MYETTALHGKTAPFLTRAALRIGLTLSCLAGLAPAVSAQPAQLDSRDPLRERPPDLARLAFTAAPLAPEEKITQDLWQLAVAAEASSPLPIIVTLAEPLPAGSASGSGLGEAGRLAAIAQLEHRLVRDGEGLGFLAERGLSHFPIVIGSVSRDRLLELASLEYVEGIEPVRTYRLSRVEGGDLVKAPQLRSQSGAAGAGVGVAVLDSGINAGHPELGGRVVASGDFTGTTGNGLDDNGHGTGVAGIIAGNTRGMAPQANLWAVKVCTADGGCRGSDILAGLDAIYAQRNSFGGLHVINMSLGSLPGGNPVSSDCDGLSPAHTMVVEQLVSAGVAVFASSGNEGCATGVGFPACLSRVIAVGAVYDADVGGKGFLNVSCEAGGTCDDPTTDADQIACFSNSGPPLDILAPSLCASTPGLGTSTQPCFGGTSAASPYAAGVAAQLLSGRPGTSPARLREALKTTGRPITDPRNGLVRRRIDAVAAYQALGNSGGGSCVSDSHTLCIDDQPDDGRFEVRADWNRTGGSGMATPIALDRVGVSRGGLFWIGDPANPEILLKVLNGCRINGHYWVFYSAGTNQGLEITVRDTVTGDVWTSTNPRGTLAPPVADTRAFSCS